MDIDRLKELAPHYVAMLLLVFLVLAIVRTAVGNLNFWIELAIVVAIVLAYPSLVMRLGVGPSVWE